jgi:hypothetical protein
MADALITIRQGESTPVFATLSAGVGTLAISGTPTVTLQDSNRETAGGIEGAAVDAVDINNAPTVKVHYTLGSEVTAALEPGRYTLLFSIATVPSETGAPQTEIVSVGIVLQYADGTPAGEGGTDCPPYYQGVNPLPVPLPCPATANATALYRQVRALLTGDPFGSNPATEMIDFYADDVLPELLRAYRCLSEDGAGVSVNPLMDDNDLRYYHRAAAIDIALRVLSGPGGSGYEAQVIKTTTDNVDRTIQQSRTLTDALLFLATEKARMLSRISCIALARKQTPAPQLFGVIGHRRAQEVCCGYRTGPMAGYDSGWFWGRWDI